MLGSLLDRWGLDDLRRVWPGYAPNPYSDMVEGYVRSLVDAIDACTDLHKAIRDGVDPQTPMDLVDCWMGEVSDEVVIEMSVLTFEYQMGLISDDSELMQFIQLEFLPPLMQCAEELLSPEEFSEFSKSFGWDGGNVPTTTAMATCTSEQASAIAMDINVALDEYMPFSVETDYLMGGLIQQSGRAQFPLFCVSGSSVPSY